MGYSITYGTTAEPLSLEDAKSHLAVDHDDDDANIARLITAARNRFESQTNRLLATRTCVLTIDDFPRQSRDYTDGVPAIRIPVWPVASVQAVNYYNAAGTEVELDSDDWTTFLGRKPSLVYPAPNCVWPTIQFGKLGAVNVEFTAGVDPEAAQGRVAMLLMIGNWYENRADQNILIADGIPPAAHAIMNGLARPMYT